MAIFSSGTVLGGGGKDVLAFLFQLAALVARLDAGFHGDAVGRGAGRIAPRVAERSAAELEAGVIAEDR